MAISEGQVSQVLSGNEAPANAMGQCRSGQGVHWPGQQPAVRGLRIPRMEKPRKSRTHREPGEPLHSAESRNLQRRSQSSGLNEMSKE